MNLQVEAVSYRYPSGVEALREVSIAFPAGSAVAILGENGAGKTTLAKQLNGLLRPTAGAVHIGDWKTTEHTVAQLARRVGYVFQNPDDQLFERTVAAEVAFGPRNVGTPLAEIDARVASALDRVGLAAMADTHPYDLHASDRRMVALAATLAMEPPIIVLDEPTTGQDASGSELVGRIVEDLKRDGRTVIVISHDVEFCSDHFERIVLMAGGQILADGPANEVFGLSEALSTAAVEAPQLVRLAGALGLTGSPRTLEAFLQAFGARRRA